MECGLDPDNKNLPEVKHSQKGHELEGGGQREVCAVNLNPWINLLETSSAFHMRRQLTQNKKKKTKKNLYLIWVDFSSRALEIFHIEHHKFH